MALKPVYTHFSLHAREKVPPSNRWHPNIKEVNYTGNYTDRVRKHDMTGSQSPIQSTIAWNTMDPSVPHVRLWVEENETWFYICKISPKLIGLHA